MSREADKGAQGDHDSMMVRVRRYFLTGILVTAPIKITLYVTWSFLVWVDSLVTPYLPVAYNPNNYLPFSMPGIGLVIAGAFFVTVGWFAKNFMGRMVIRISEYIVHHLPVVRTVYSALKQIFETLMTDQSQAFREVVMFEYPRPGMWAMGFVTGVARGEARHLADEEILTVFLPMTPPTSGFLLFVPRKDVRVMNMTVEEGLKMSVSAGMITPPDRTTPVAAMPQN